MRTELESGAWVEHTPIQDLKARDKDAVSRLVTANLPVTEGQEMPGLDAEGRADLLMLQRDAVWAQVLSGWSFDLPLPVISGAVIGNRESLAELPLDDYDELIALLTPFAVKLLRVPSPKGPPAATTSSSNGSSRARAHGSRKG